MCIFYVRTWTLPYNNIVNEEHFTLSTPRIFKFLFFENIVGPSTTVALKSHSFIRLRLFTELSIFFFKNPISII